MFVTAAPVTPQPIMAQAIARAECEKCAATVTVFRHGNGRVLGIPTGRLDGRTRVAREWRALPVGSYEVWQCGACDRWQW